MKKYEFFDNDEKEIVEAWEKGEFQPVDHEQAMKSQLKQAAARYLRKDARINIRMSTADLEMFKRRAAQEGMPYQTLIASVLHKYISGQYQS